MIPVTTDGNNLFQKLTVLLISTCYIITLLFVNDTCYVWVTLALIFTLFVSTFICAKDTPPVLLQLRGTRLAEISRRTIAQEEGGVAEPQSTPQSQTRIWMTDIPPSYSFVMSNLAPPTPPPSYGSAILMFPLDPSSQGKSEATLLSDLPITFHPLSISTQVSVCSLSSDTQPISFSTQVSVVSGGSDVAPDTVSLRTQLFLSRQLCENSAPVPLSTKPDQEEIGEESGPAHCQTVTDLPPSPASQHGGNYTNINNK